MNPWGWGLATWGCFFCLIVKLSRQLKWATRTESHCCSRLANVLQGVSARWDKIGMQLTNSFAYKCHTFEGENHSGFSDIPVCFCTSETSNLEKNFEYLFYNSYAFESFSLMVFWWKLSGSSVGAGSEQVLVRGFLCCYVKNRCSSSAFRWASWNPAVDFKQSQSLVRTLECTATTCLKTSTVCFCTLRKMIFLGPDFCLNRAPISIKPR